MSTNDKITLCCDLINKVGGDSYSALCNKYGVGRMLDAPDHVVIEEWEKHCELTTDRAHRLLDAVSSFNRSNLSRQIKARVDVYGGTVMLTVNDKVYNKYGLLEAVTALRNIGLRFDIKVI